LWLSGALSALAAFIMVAVLVAREASLLNVALLLMAYAAVVASLNVRRFALRLQDRIIRLEMQTRLTRLGREADLGRLSMRQIVALRFASDAELPALIARATAEDLTDDQIKRAITTWQADHLRT
jgi:hypothetical protein